MNKTVSPPTRTDRTLLSVRVQSVRLWAGFPWTEIRFVQFVRGLPGTVTTSDEALRVPVCSCFVAGLKQTPPVARIGGMTSDVRFRVDPGDVPPEKAGRLWGLTLDSSGMAVPAWWFVPDQLPLQAAV